MNWPQTEAEVSSLVERGLAYFPKVKPELFVEPEEWRLYFAMIECHERQSECIERGDYFGALKAAAQMVEDGGLAK